MTRAVLAAPLMILLGGCASPFAERWDVGGNAGERRGELPAWVTDEWDTSERRSTRNAGPAIGSRLRGNDVGRRSERPADALPARSLDELLAWALEHNPSVQAAEARWHAATQRIVPAQTLPEPELSYRVIVEQIDTDRDPIGHAVGISQMFPWFGTLERAAEVKAAEARAAARQYVQQQLAVVSAVKRAWAEYAYLHGAAAVLREQGDLLRQLETVVRSRFRTGEVGQRDLVRVEAEIDRLTNDLRDAEEMTIAAAARLNAAVGRPSDAPLPDAPALPQQEIEIDAADLVERLARLNPTLEVLREQLAARRHAKQLAERRFYPEIMLGIEYGVDASRRMARMDGGGSDMLMGMIGLRLPIWRDAYEAEVREAMAEWGATLRDLTDRQHTIEAELKMTIYAVRDAQRRVNLFGDRLRLRAEQVLHATEAAYRAGEATFTDLIEAQRELLEFSLAAQRGEADRFAQIARLEELIGRSLDTAAPQANTAHAEPRTRLGAKENRQ